VRSLWHPFPALSEEETKKIQKELKTLDVWVERPDRKANGYTGVNARHVVIKDEHFDKLDPHIPSTKAGIEKALLAFLKGEETSWSFSRAAKDAGTLAKAYNVENNRSLITYIHEIGHRIHIDTDEGRVMPNNGFVTQYSRDNAYEHVAEAFVAWAVAPKELQAANRSQYNFIDKLVSDSLKAKVPDYLEV
jgi:hypothetical protein